MSPYFLQHDRNNDSSTGEGMLDSNYDYYHIDTVANNNKNNKKTFLKMKEYVGI